VKRSLATLPAETALWNRIAKKPSPPPPKDIWQDIFAKYLALADPAEALKTWERWGSVETGASRSDTLNFMLQPGGHGHARLQHHAPTRLCTRFSSVPDGSRTYLAFNARKTPLEVKFSDGKRLSVAPGQLAKVN
jgi:hypothetical protein